MKRKAISKTTKGRKPAAARARVAPRVEDAFAEVVTLIQSARHRALQAVNTELVGLYWQVGEYISRKLASAEWGDQKVSPLVTQLPWTHSRALSPALIAQYQTQLPEKRLLQAKLHEFYQMLEAPNDEDALVATKKLPARRGKGPTQ